MSGVSENVIIALMGSSVMVALITLLSSVINFKLNRKANLEDKKLAKSDKVSKLERDFGDLSNKYDKLNDSIGELSVNVGNIKIGLRMVLHDMILKTATTYIQRGKITLSEKSMLKSMHSVYHNNLDGNGDLNEVMDIIEDIECTID